MTNPLHAPYYADRAVQCTVEVVENVPLARDTFRVRFHCPDMAARITPGQFLMLRLSDCDDPLIGRPLAMYDSIPDANGNPCFIDVVYLVKGKLTRRLCRLREGQRLDVWGPLGNGFPLSTADHLIMVAGGIGQTPFLALAKESLGLQTYGIPPRQGSRTKLVTLCYGARSGDLLAGIEDFRATGLELSLCTDDGSLGHHGLVTDLLGNILEEPATGNRQIVCCGPEPMMEAVSELARTSNTDCLVSLETPMACGVGICFTCVAEIRDDEGRVNYKRTCVEGPVFDAAKICW